jgi:uncharacterized surface protein with fasciclin (FAS1) repeats
MTNNHFKNVFAFLITAVLSVFVIGCQPAPGTDNTNDNAPLPATIEPTVEVTEAMTEAPTEAATVEMTDEATDEATAEATSDDGGEAPTPAVLDEEVASGTTAETIAAGDERFGVFGQVFAQILNSGMLADVDLESAQFTIFIPNDESEVTEADLTAVMSDSTVAQGFFGCYLVEGSMSLQDLLDAGEVTTVSGETLTVSSEDEGLVWINDEAQIVNVIATSNGYIYLVNDLICDPSGE